MEDSYFNASPKKSIYFVIALVILLLCEMLSVNTDLAGFSNHSALNIPSWFYTLIFTIDALVILGIVLIYFYRKIGVFMVPVFVIAHYLLHGFYLSTLLYSDLNMLFFYVCAGLFMVIPRWKFFK